MKGTRASYHSRHPLAKHGHCQSACLEAPALFWQLMLPSVGPACAIGSAGTQAKGVRTWTKARRSHGWEGEGNEGDGGPLSLSSHSCCSWSLQSVPLAGCSGCSRLHHAFEELGSTKLLPGSLLRQGIFFHGDTPNWRAHGKPQHAGSIFHIFGGRCAVAAPGKAQHWLSPWSRAASDI